MLEATNAGLQAKIANPKDPILLTKLIPKSQQQQQMHVQKQKQDKTPQHFEEKPQAGNSYEYKNFNDKKSNENSYDYKTDSKVKYLNWKNANMYQNDDNKTRSQKPLSMSGILHELTYEIEQNNISNVQLWLAINIKYKPAKEKLVCAQLKKMTIVPIVIVLIPFLLFLIMWSRGSHHVMCHNLKFIFLCLTNTTYILIRIPENFG